MPTTLHIRDVPDPIHATLAERAQARGMSLRQYTIAVLREHCALPTLDEWLSSVEELPPVATPVSGAEAVQRAREADDRELALARGRR